ncbi:MAG: hypothetical protein HY246_16595 [Proteobacteria bacterium]|nr:hypothetical protein [Pseudomonadota bacterium]
MSDASAQSEFAAAASRPGPALASPVLLGLFMLLLAFFILLVSVSTRSDHRAREVMGALGGAFGQATAAGNGRAAMSLGDGEAAASGFLPEMGRLISTSIQLAKVEQARSGRQLRLTVPVSSVFASAEVVVLPEAVPLLTEIARQLARRPSGLRHDLEFFVGRGEEAERALSLQRAATMARTLLELGAPRDSVGAGLAPAAGDVAVFMFYLRGAEDGRVRFREVDNVL